jgi:hypothetical protein
MVGHFPFRDDDKLAIFIYLKSGLLMMKTIPRNASKQGLSQSRVFDEPDERYPQARCKP